MKYINALLGLSGVLCWIFAYMLIAYRGVKDKTYGIPLIPLAFNLGWEFVFSFCFPFNVYAQVTNALWFFCDLGIVYTYFKYGYSSFNAFYGLEKRQWYLISGFAFLIGFLFNFLGYNFFSQYLSQFPSAEIPVFLAWMILLITPVCMLAMFLQRKNSQGQSFIIIASMIIGNFFFILQFFLHPFYYKWSNPFLVLIVTVSVIIELYYAKLLYKQLLKEGINPWKRF
ncbi:hypothetical protein [Flavobacterium sp. ENC]|uniref:transmembrane-type terpene cyclase n=1 Tax=Flavobacterium sp. ENC TaxID=2897330 RepID=UPI001E2F334F|nr:hypothetical protein [Flavobacterium sp. ENC]MCD0467298.1 hypothetical protein [Flavobacterium sp. ENC]